MSSPKRSEEWMLLAIGELRRLLSDMEEAAWPPSAWARYRLECALAAAENGDFKRAYEVGLWDPASARRHFDEAGGGFNVPPPSISDYRGRIDVIPVLDRRPKGG